MARARDNRKPVGEEKCLKCGGHAEFYQVQKGRYLGHLYRKGCDCRVIQNAPPYLQLEWLERMTRTPHPMVPHPLTVAAAPVEPVPEPVEPEPKEKPEPEPVEPRASIEGNPKQGGKRATLIGVGLLIGSVFVAALS